MSDRLEQLYTLIQTYPKRAIGFAALAVVILALPLTLTVSQQQQNLTQNAASAPCQAGDEQKISDTQIVGCHNGVWDAPSTAYSCTGGKVMTQVGKKADGTPDYSCMAPTAPTQSNAPAQSNPPASNPPASEPPASGNPTPTPTPTPTASPTDNSQVNACGTAVPSNFFSATQAQAQKENPSTTVTNCGQDGLPACQALNADQWTQAAKDAGFTQDQIDQSGIAGSPYVPLVCQQNPDQCTQVPGAPSGQTVNYTGCLGVSDNFGTQTNIKAYCYQNGNLKSTTDISGTTDMVALSQQELGCTPGGGYVSSGGGNSTSSNNTAQPSKLGGNSGLSTVLGLNVGLSGLRGTNPADIKTTVKNFVVQLLNTQNQVVASKNVPLNFNQQTQSFTGNVDLSALTQNVEGLKVAVGTPGYFQSSTSTVVPIAANRINNVSIPDLQAGNIVPDTSTSNVANLNQTPNILDYNAFMSCSIFSKDGGSACKGQNGQSLKSAADLNGDGVVNQDDYTILLQSWKKSSGGGNPSPTPKSTCTPRPAQCSDPTKACAFTPPVGGWCPISNPVPVATCLPRPSCLDSVPRCLIAEPAQGWCNITPAQKGN